MQQEEEPEEKDLFHQRAKSPPQILFLFSEGVAADTTLHSLLTGLKTFSDSLNSILELGPVQRTLVGGRPDSSRGMFSSELPAFYGSGT